MSTKIDQIEVEITSTSTGAAAGIDALATSLGKLKQNGTISVAVKNLNNLSTALKNMTSASSNANKISSLADAMAKLKSVGSAGTGVKKMAESLGSLRNVDYGSLSKVAESSALFERVGASLSKLSTVSTGGFSSMVNSLAKIGKVTDSLDDDTITRFTDRVTKLSDALTPLSSKMTTIQAGLRGVNSSAKSAGNGVGSLGTKVNATSVNLASMVTIIQGVTAALRPVVRLLSSVISEAIEWDGVAARFGRGFGSQSQEVYDWIQRLNKEMGINTQQFMQYSSVFSTMLQGFGVGVEDSGKMALGYTELIYDVWAGYNDVYKNFGDAADAIKSAIAGEVEPIRRAGFTIVESTLEQTAANHGLKISLENATEAQKSYLRYLTLVDQAHAQNLVGAYAREMNTAEGVMRTFAQQLKSLAQSFGSLFLPILVKVMPWLQAFVNLLTEAIHKAAAFFGIEIQPIDWSGVTDGGASLEGVGDAAGDAAEGVDGVTEAVKDLKRATIGIDELNVISPPSKSAGAGTGGVGGDLSGFEDLDVDSLWDDSIFDSIQFQVDDIMGKLKEALTQITAVVSGFMLAIGTILVVSGANIPMGLALMAAGAVGLVAVIASNWNSMSDQLAKTLTTVTAVLGGFLLAIGAFLTFSGVNVGLGAALMVAGAVSLGTALTINWKFLNGDMKNTLSILTGIVAGGLLAMGALFAFTGVAVGLGIGLMVAGAVGLATSVGLNWDAMSEPMRKAIGTLEMIVGTAMLAYGAVLAFSGANIPLGIALMAAGAVSMVAAEKLNWDSLNGTIGNKLATLTALVGGAALGLGAILAFTGVATGVGIALMAAGAAGIIGTAPINWSSLMEKIKVVLKEIGAAIGISLLAVGAVLAFTGVALPLGVSLMAAGAVSLVSAIALNWDSIVTSIKNVLKEIGVAAGAAMLALGILLVCTGVGIPLGIGLIVAGAGSLVAGVALNWNAIVDKVKETVSAIGDAWGNLWDACKNGIKKMWDGIVGWFTDLWDTLVGHSIVPDTVDGITKCFTDLPGRVLGVVGNFVGNIIDKFKDFGSKIVSKVSSGWESVKSWWSNKKGLETAQVAVSLVKKGWNTIKEWIGNIPGVSQAVNLAKSGWSTIKGWIGKIPGISQAVSLIKKGWSTIKNWVGKIPGVSQAVSLAKKGWSSVKSWVGNIPTLSAGIKLVKNGWSSVKSWLGNLNFNLGFKLPKIKVKWSEKTVAGFTIKYPSGFNTYAKGGFPNMGEMFIAREAGPELVGKIGNRTTVANNEQIVEGVSEGVYAAVLAAMRASENNGSQSVNVYLDGRQIMSAMEKRQRERGSALMGNQIYSY